MWRFLRNLRKIRASTVIGLFFVFFFVRGWAMIAHLRIALRCSAYLLGVATLGRVAGEIRVNSEDGVKIDMNQNGTLKCQLGLEQ